jgi:hypothetical protein
VSGAAACELVRCNSSSGNCCWGRFLAGLAEWTSSAAAAGQLRLAVTSCAGTPVTICYIFLILWHHGVAENMYIDLLQMASWRLGTLELLAPRPVFGYALGGSSVAL